MGICILAARSQAFLKFNSIETNKEVDGACGVWERGHALRLDHELRIVGNTHVAFL